MFKTIKTASDIKAEKAEAERVARIAELKSKLSETDFAALPDYDGDATEIIKQRKAWRKELRSLKAC